MQYEWRNNILEAKQEAKIESIIENKQGVKLQTDGDRENNSIQYVTAKERLKRSTTKNLIFYGRSRKLTEIYEEKLESFGYILGVNNVHMHGKLGNSPRRLR